MRAYASILLVVVACARPAAQPLQAPEVFDVAMETTKGPITIEVHRDWAPRGADRFYELVRARYFDDSRVFRVRAGFVAQFGIAGDARVATAWRTRTIADDSVRQSNVRGTLAYATTGPNTRSTQIYINLADNARLDADGFAPFGRVIRGMDVVDRLYAEFGESSGGGMRTGKQDSMFALGNAWLDRAFPKLDRIVSVRLVR